MPGNPGLVISNRVLPILDETLPRINLGPLFVYHRDLLHDIPTAGFELDIRHFRLREIANAVWPAADRDLDAPTVLTVREDSVSVSTGALNQEGVYFAASRHREHFVYFTDLFLAPAVLSGLDLPLVVRAHHPYDDGATTAVTHVQRLTHGIDQRIFRSDGGWSRETRLRPDPLARYRHPTRTDVTKVGVEQITAVEAEVGRLTNENGWAGYATLLSGGIDSGLVTMCAAACGVPVRAYGIGTPWGDEFDNAAELADFAGVEFDRYRLDEDQIVAAIPETVRWLGVTEPEVVEVGIMATAAHRYGVIEPRRVLLTGFGSDMINAGLVGPSESAPERVERGLRIVHGTRFTNELSNHMPLAYGRQVHHPFWTHDVMDIALDTSPECKVAMGREKYHLRSALESRVPHTIAWRQKVAGHHGGGMQEGVARRLMKDTGHRDRRRVYANCLTEILRLGARHPVTDWDAREVYERAVLAATDR